MTHAEAANAAMARLGMTLASPQKVIGPAEAAVNSSVAAGAAPIPTSSSAATSGISNSRGTLISRPTVAAMATPARWLPARLETVSASIHCMTRPLAKPAMTMMGPRRRRYFRLERSQARPASGQGLPPGGSVRLRRGFGPRVQAGASGLAVRRRARLSALSGWRPRRSGGCACRRSWVRRPSRS